MQQTNDESAKLNNLDLLKILQPHVTGFSEQILKEGKHKDPVICGGVVKNILDMNTFSFTTQVEEYEIVHAEDIVYVTIDDAIGELLLIVPGETWRKAGANLEQIIIAEGVLYSLERTGTFVNKAAGVLPFTRTDEEPLRVLVVTVTKLKESL